MTLLIDTDDDEMTPLPCQRGKKKKGKRLPKNSRRIQGLDYWALLCNPFSKLFVPSSNPKKIRFRDRGQNWGRVAASRWIKASLLCSLIAWPNFVIFFWFDCQLWVSVLSQNWQKAGKERNEKEKRMRRKEDDLWGLRNLSWVSLI